MEKEEDAPNEKVVTFKIAGELEPTPNPIYDCVVPIYPVDFACQHKKQPPWWERELNFMQLQDLIHVWYNELEEDYNLFQLQVKEQNQKDLMICTNQEKLTLLVQSINAACISQRSLDCDLEMLAHQMNVMHKIVAYFEVLYSQPIRENQCKLIVYKPFEEIFLKLKQTEYNLHEVHLECNNRVSMFRERGTVGQIFSILNTLIFILQKLSNKLEELEKQLVFINTSREKYVATATKYAEENNDLDLILDIDKFRKNAPLA